VVTPEAANRTTAARRAHRRRHHLGMRALLGASAVAAGWAAPALAPVAPALASSMRVARRFASTHGVALTFDDGPHREGTPRILDLLDTAGATATFFMVGERVLDAPEVAAEVAARGHAIAVHGHRHRNLLRLSPRAAARDLDRAHEAIAHATRTSPTLHRPPYGIYSWPALHAVRARGWTPLLWSHWGHDWRAWTTPRRIAAELTRALGPGDVLLLHDADDYSAPGSWRRTVAALPHVLEAIAAAGLRAEAVTAGSTAARTSGA
jgi:peptidoglycan/xylan/chitin deacetylase (PgdA/CDA1 family)